MALGGNPVFNSRNYREQTGRAGNGAAVDAHHCGPEGGKADADARW